MTAAAGARPHGRVKYSTEKCRCDVCRAANRDYERDRRRHRAYGRTAFVDAAPVLEHVLQLRADGLSSTRIAELTGVAKSVLKKLQYGDRARGQAPLKRMRKYNADRLLALTAEPRLRPAGARTDITGTRRRLQALVALGWSQAQLAQRLGTPHNHLGLMLHRNSTCSVARARAVVTLYDELWDCPPVEDTPEQRWSASRARRNARLRRYAPPLAWDDETIDDPAARPAGGVRAPVRDVDPVVVAELVAGRMPNGAVRPVERQAAVATLTARQVSADEIARMVGITPRGVQRIRGHLAAAS